ncbi:MULTISPECIES: CmlA/FloR family chloramphenicol efflux MFS transporter [Phaeobacter]|uniref:Bcr/CflA family efflux transporter n=3 Tax=Phaeobacter TaxID=302485 RepID=A0AAD0EF38_9RHOB|nr:MULTISPECIES: CmlA/FloR family chloramphenicol efflux MFS transporter [Phaeobacter]ATE99575.1 putative bicyclomycin resistance protein [Phaeobacter gallaeciensis]ATF08165.1 putative bicyclomycin resistance protein [Phaeobacter gallaeciensis]ATG45893.1 putative bicyclomycin resistance protein [Phaeobacter piscinae]AUR01835.1 putative bicyclomycin resistance protein [Phaeobacter inhibens]
MYKNDNRLWSYSLTAALALLIPFNLLASLGMDIYLPVVPAMPANLGTSASVVQMTLSLYMIMLGVGQVLFGPISDRVGRRPVLVIGVGLFITATLGLAATSFAPAFVALRVVQAVGASAMLVAVFATIRDVYAEKPESGAIYSLMNAMLSFVPALGPIAGALIADALGWRWIFWLLALTTIAVAITVIPNWPETRTRQERTVTVGALDILKSRAFWAYTVAFGTAMGTFFVFFSTAPRVLIEMAGMSELGFSIVFATVAAVMIAASRFAPGFVARWENPGCVFRGLALIFSAALLLMLRQFGWPNSVALFIVPMWIGALGIVMIGAVTANGALSDFGDAAGTAVALHFCGQSVIVGLVGTAFIVLLGGSTAFPLVGYMAFMSVVAAVWVWTTLPRASLSG